MWDVGCGNSKLAQRKTHIPDLISHITDLDLIRASKQDTRLPSNDLDTLGGTCEADRFARTQAHVLELIFGDQNT
jgi:hypothetical protein